MAYYRKNKKRFDPRYFLNERAEKVNEESANKENNFHNFSFDSWGLEESNCGSDKPHNRDDKKGKDPEEADCKPDFLDSDGDGNKSECWPKDPPEELEELVVPGPEPKMSSRGPEFEKAPFPGGGVEDLPDETPTCGDGNKPMGGGYRVSSRFGELVTPDRSRESLNAAASFAMHLIQNMGLSDEEMEMSPEVLDVVAPTRMEEG